MYGEMFVGGVQVWAFGDGLIFECIVEFELEVVMQLSGVVFLDYEVQGVVFMLFVGFVVCICGFLCLCEIVFVVVVGEMVWYGVGFVLLCVFVCGCFVCCFGGCFVWCLFVWGGFVFCVVV